MSAKGAFYSDYTRNFKGWMLTIVEVLKALATLLTSCMR